MNASQIAIAILERPEFDNTHLGNPHRWMQDNTGLLARFWNQCGHALGITEEDNEELDIWIRCQHDIELMNRNRRRLPHGVSL